MSVKLGQDTLWSLTFTYSRSCKVKQSVRTWVRSRSAPPADSLLTPLIHLRLPLPSTRRLLFHNMALRWLNVNHYFSLFHQAPCSRSVRWLMPTSTGTNYLYMRSPRWLDIRLRFQPLQIHTESRCGHRLTCRMPDRYSGGLESIITWVRNSSSCRWTDVLSP